MQRLYSAINIKLDADWKSEDWKLGNFSLSGKFYNKA